MTATAFADTITRFTDDPSTGRVSPSVTATMANGHARLAAGPFNWDTDLPPAVGGHNEAPSPTAYLLGALAGCAAAFMSATLAPQFGVDLDECSATASCRTDLGGLLGIEGAGTTLQGISVEIRVRSSSPADRVEAMQQAWLARCPVYLALRDPNPVEVTFA